MKKLNPCYLLPPGCDDFLIGFSDHKIYHFDCFDFSQVQSFINTYCLIHNVNLVIVLSLNNSNRALVSALDDAFVDYFGESSSSAEF